MKNRVVCTVGYNYAYFKYAIPLPQKLVFSFRSYTDERLELKSIYALIYKCCITFDKSCDNFGRGNVFFTNLKDIVVMGPD